MADALSPACPSQMGQRKVTCKFKWGFLKQKGVPYFGVLIIRILRFRVLY